MLKSLTVAALKRLGYTIYRTHNFTIAEYRAACSDMDEDFFPLFEQCKPFTMTTIERMYALYKAVEYVVTNQIPGDIVECGVWKGGSIMLIALTLQRLGDKSRSIYLYDTFDGMSEPTGRDVDKLNRSAVEYLQAAPKESNIIWAYASLPEVQNNVLSTGYPTNKVVFVQGKVEDTLPSTCPSKISLLRLDTDWYESTYHEMRCLFPLVSPRGVLIQDDYGEWRGAKDATDRYLREERLSLLLQRIDSSARLAIKT